MTFVTFTGMSRKKWVEIDALAYLNLEYSLFATALWDV